MAKQYLIALDDGHGMETAGKRTPTLPDGRVIHENTYNSAVTKKLATALERCGFKTLMTAPGDNDVSLETRVKIANAAGADLFISNHYNALNGLLDNKSGGVETFYNTGSTTSQKLANCVHKYVIQGTKQVDRGVKEANFYVLRKTSMPAILVEGGFMDCLKEALLMTNEDFILETAEQEAQGICEYFGLEYIVPGKEHGDNYLQQCLDVLVKNNILTSPKYWLENAREGKTVDGAFAANLLKNMATYLKSK